MKTIRVVAAVIRAVNGDGRQMIFATQRGYGEFKAAGNFPAVKLKTVRHHKKPLSEKLLRNWKRKSKSAI